MGFRTACARLGSPTRGRGEKVLRNGGRRGARRKKDVYKLRRFDSGDAQTDADFDKIIDGVSKAIATAEPYENRNCLIFDYKNTVQFAKTKKGN